LSELVEARTRQLERVSVRLQESMVDLAASQSAEVRASSRVVSLEARVAELETRLARRDAQLRQELADKELLIEEVEALRAGGEWTRRTAAS
jgi:Skp family chaperone for outer membrane proteins